MKDSLYNARSGIAHDPEYEELGIKSQVRGKPSLTDADFKEVRGGAGGGRDYAHWMRRVAPFCLLSDNARGSSPDNFLRSLVASPSL